MERKAGLPPFDPVTGEAKRRPFAVQAETVLEQMKHCLEAAGSSMQQVLKCNVYREILSCRDARAIFLCVPCFPGPFDIEIDCIAAIA